MIMNACHYWICYLVLILYRVKLVTYLLRMKCLPGKSGDCHNIIINNTYYIKDIHVSSFSLSNTFVTG